MFIWSLPWMLATGFGLIISLWASARVKSAFHRYSQVGVASRMTGADAARAVANSGGANDVTIERFQGFLSDHYDPRSKTLRLSPAVYDGQSISSIAVAAHEAGHAIQHAHAYAPLGLRSKLVPVCMVGNNLWPLILMAGFVMQLQSLVYLGIVLFSAFVLFQLVTLPVEFDATKRAKAVLASTGIVSNQQEAIGVNKVLDAAAMTYVAAAVTAILQLIVLILRARER